MDNLVISSRNYWLSIHFCLMTYYWLGYNSLPIVPTSRLRILIINKKKLFSFLLTISNFNWTNRVLISIEIRDWIIPSGLITLFCEYLELLVTGILQKAAPAGNSWSIVDFSRRWCRFLQLITRPRLLSLRSQWSTAETARSNVTGESP